jgi:hypothetical protein
MEKKRKKNEKKVSTLHDSSKSKKPLYICKNIIKISFINIFITKIQNNQFNTKPSFCYDKCVNCSAKANYLIEEINDKHITPQNKILDELIRHGHKRALKYPHQKRFRNTVEARLELIKHIEEYHIESSSVNFKTKPSAQNLNENKKHKKNNLKNDTTSAIMINPGMINLGNSCFISATIQSLKCVPLISNYFLNGGFK